MKPKFIYHLGRVWQQFADPGTALAMLAEFEN
jgi:hypothetical protein